MKQSESFKTLFLIDHPLVQDKLSSMRDKNCSVGKFRSLLKEISFLMGYEVTRSLSLKIKTISTPMQNMDAPVLAEDLPVVVPILRAGLGMVDGLVSLMPECFVGHIGLYRDENTHKPVEYLVRLPKYNGQKFIVVDPMLATGHSSVKAIDILVHHGVPQKNISLMCLVAAPEGVKTVEKHYGDLSVYTAALDDRLNDDAYIIPGLGDAGDRIFGTF